MAQREVPAGAELGGVWSSIRALDWRDYVIYIGFVAIFIFFAINLDDECFLSENHLLNIVRQTATISVMAVAMTFVIGAAQIDLTVGAVA